MVLRDSSARRSALAISVTEAAHRLGIGRNTAYEAVHQGELPAIRVGRRLLVPIEALERLMSNPPGVS